MKAISESGRVHVVTKTSEAEYRTLCGQAMIAYDEDMRPEDTPVTCKRCLRMLEKEKGHER